MTGTERLLQTQEVLKGKGLRDPVVQELQPVVHRFRGVCSHQPHESSGLRANGCALVGKHDDARVMAAASQPVTVQAHEISHVGCIDNPA